MNFANALQGLAGLIWLAVVGLIAIAFTRASRRQPTRGLSSIILVMAIVAVAITSVAAGLVFVEPEERGVIISAVAPQGYRLEPLQPGLRWVIPFLERVVRYTISKQTYTMSGIANEGQVQGDDSITARTFDGQEIIMDASVIYGIDPAKVVDLHIIWQDRYMNDLVRPVTRGVIRDAVSQYRVEEVVSTKRGEMSQQISDGLKQKLAENGLILSEFVLRNITFSPEYAASVEQKQIAEQQAQQARLVVEQRKQEAEQARQVAQGQADAVVINAKGQADARLIQAEAEARALELIAGALQDNADLLTYNYINKIAPGVQVMLVPNNQPFLLPLPTVGPPASSAAAEPTAVPTPLPQPSPPPAAPP